ncbi:MAG TPA: nitroreductase family protein [Cytophagales bacterium]|jgi:iodotyrosine deiodinase|nr:nitroreductase family protein [Cytophagales bacterium]
MDHQTPENPAFIPYNSEKFEVAEMIERSRLFYKWADKRRSLRMFSDQPVPRQVIENIIKTASTAPSGAHKQPWTFCAVSNPEIKSEIRKAAEKEEFESYNHRMSDEWLEDLKAFDTDWNKPFLETVPWLIVVFSRSFEWSENGQKHQNYYVKESVGLACGMLLNAIHNSGLVALTHTPSPMNFLQEILGRPKNERPFLLIPVGYAAKEAQVPKLKRKSLEEISVWYE